MVSKLSIQNFCTNHSTQIEQFQHIQLDNNIFYNDKRAIVYDSFNISNLKEDELVFLLKSLKEMANNSK